jgi:hypothetical protein
MCGSGVRWCTRADAMFDVPGMHVLEVEVDEQQRLVLTVESDQLEMAVPAAGCSRSGTAAAAVFCMTPPAWAR